jgi:hypothetical protein
MRCNIYSAKTAAILVLGTAGFAFTPQAQACGEPHGQAGLAALAVLARQLETQSDASLSSAQLTSPAATRCHGAGERPRRAKASLHCRHVDCGLLPPEQPALGRSH